MDSKCFFDLDWPTNASSPLSASDRLLVYLRVSAVIATATWLGGWLAGGGLSVTAGIVSK